MRAFSRLCALFSVKQQNIFYTKDLPGLWDQVTDILGCGCCCDFLIFMPDIHASREHTGKSLVPNIQWYWSTACTKPTRDTLQQDPAGQQTVLLEFQEDITFFAV